MKDEDAKLVNGKLVDSLGNTLKCVKKVGNYKIYVEPFMHIKKYYSFHMITNEIKFEGVNGLSYIVQRLIEQDDIIK